MCVCVRETRFEKEVQAKERGEERSFHRSVLSRVCVLLDRRFKLLYKEYFRVFNGSRLVVDQNSRS